MSISAVPPLPEQKSSGLALASLILGCCSFVFCCLTGVPAIICSVFAFIQINKNPGMRGQGFAIAGVILGGLSLIALPFFAGLTFPAVSSAMNKAKQTQEMADIRQVGLSLFTYANDHDGKYPDDLETLVKNNYLVDEHLLYKKGTQQFRWVLTPALTTSSIPDSVLLRSAEALGERRQRGHAVYTVDNKVQWVKESSY